MTNKREHRETVLVTGAAKRIGKAICLSLAEQGYKIALHYHKSSRDAEKLAETIQKSRGKCQLFRCDLSNERQTRQLIPNVCKKFGSLHVLINNASIFEKSTIKSLNVSSLHEHFSVNFDAPVVLTSVFANICKKGNVINILDTNIVKNSTCYTTYLLSKKSLYEFTKLSAVELAPHIRVNAVSPGIILPSNHTKADQLKRLTKKVPLRNKGHVGHITQTIDFLLKNPYITGQIIFNDGGEHLI